MPNRNAVNLSDEVRRLYQLLFSQFKNFPYLCIAKCVTTKNTNENGRKKSFSLRVLQKVLIA